MGNLINPIALRLGWVRTWEVSYFCKNLYYPWFLHLIYKYKLFILSHMRTKLYEKGFGILFSHLEFIKVGRNFNVYFFTYQSSLEGFIQEFVIQEFWFVRNLIPNKRQYYDMRLAQKAVLFFLIYCMSFSHIDRNINFKNDIHHLWPSGWWLRLIKNLNAFDDCIVWYMLMFGPFSRVLLGYKTRFFLWYTIFKKFMLLRHLTWWEALLEFCYWYLSSWGFDCFFRGQSWWFSFIGKFIFKLDVSVVWYRITSLFNPIRRELQVLMGVLELNQQNLMKKNKVHLKFSYKQLIKKQFLMYYKFFNQERYFFFCKFKTWITCEDLIWFCRSNWDKKFMIRLVRTLPWITLWQKNRIWFNAKLILQKVPFFFYLGKYAVLYFYLDKDFTESWVTPFFKKYVGCSAILFKNFVKYVWVENSAQLVKMLKLNKLKLRNIKVTQPLNFGLSGFKVQFVGRFSRKQRASSIFFQHGRLPLNTVCANIEYATHTIPLKNSAITVKVWFYQTKFVYSPYVQLWEHLL